jgi:MFS family permease
VRFLPSTLMVMIVGPIAGRLSDRIGPRPLMVVGLLVVSASLLWQSRLQVDSGFGFLLPAFVSMGIGIALVMSPMSTAAMNAVDTAKAGVASGVLSMSRMVGGTFGVAALGALVAGLGGSKLRELLPGVPEAERAKLTDALGAGGESAAAAGSPAADAMREAFVYALQYGLLIGGLVALVGAVFAAWLVGDRAERVPEPPLGDLEAAAAAGPAAEPARAAEPIRS